MIMFYGTAAVSTVLFVLAVIGTHLISHSRTLAYIMQSSIRFLGTAKCFSCQGVVLRLRLLCSVVYMCTEACRYKEHWHTSASRYTGVQVCFCASKGQVVFLRLRLL